MKKSLLISVISLLLYACGNDNPHKVITETEERVEVTETDSTLSLPLDSNTKTKIYTLRYFVDSTGIEYITLEQGDYDSKFGAIIFYRLDSCKMSHIVRLNYEGSNTIVPVLRGHTALSKDEILVSTDLKWFLYKVNSQGEILRQYVLYDDKHSREDYLPNYLMTLYNNPLIQKGGYYYVGLGLPAVDDSPSEDRVIEFDKRSLMLRIDTASGEQQVSKLHFPVLYKKAKGDYYLNGHCYDYDGNNFVFSFNGLDSLYVSGNLETFKVFPARSKYADVVNKGFQRNLGVVKGTTIYHNQARYGNILYDKFRKVFYRFCHLEDKKTTEDDFNPNLKNNSLMCKAEFSIQVIDSEFNVIGETLFPRGKYAPMISFINKDGLWISENNYEKDMSEDFLVFRCLKISEL